MSAPSSVLQTSPNGSPLRAATAAARRALLGAVSRRTAERPAVRRPRVPEARDPFWERGLPEDFAKGLDLVLGMVAAALPRPGEEDEGEGRTWWRRMDVGILLYGRSFSSP